MGAITAVPREVVPLVNHSPGFAVLCGSDILSQTDVASFWDLADLNATGEKEQEVLSPTSITPLQPADRCLGSWGRGGSGHAKPCMQHELSHVAHCYADEHKVTKSVVLY